MQTFEDDLLPVVEVDPAAPKHGRGDGDHPAGCAPLEQIPYLDRRIKAVDDLGLVSRRQDDGDRVWSWLREQHDFALYAPLREEFVGVPGLGERQPRGDQRVKVAVGEQPEQHPQAYLRWRNANARHPDVIAAQRRERTRVRGERHQRWGRPPAQAA